MYTFNSLCIILVWAIFSLFSSINAQNYYSNNIPELTKNYDVPWALFHPEHHQDSLRVVKRGGQRNRRVEYPETPNYIEECVQVITMPGTYVVRPGMGTNRACGVYIAALHDETITVDVSHVDVSCEYGGLVAFFDGWEMNGHIFPGEYGHKHDLNERIAQLCKETFPRGQILRLKSSQNVALMQYRIPLQNEGFVFRVSMERNPDPCNVLMTEEKRLFTLSNGGEARNCSLTAVLNPPNLKLRYFQIGEHPSQNGLISPCEGEDYVDIGGASTLDPSQMEVKERICGFEPRPAKMGLTILCDSSSIRLVSSGYYENLLTVSVREADEQDMNFEENILMVCPGFD